MIAGYYRRRHQGQEMKSSSSLATAYAGKIAEIFGPYFSDNRMHSRPRIEAASAMISSPIPAAATLLRLCFLACLSIASTSISNCRSRACLAMAQAAASPISSVCADGAGQAAQRGLASLSGAVRGIAGITILGDQARGQISIGGYGEQLRR